MKRKIMIGIFSLLIALSSLATGCSLINSPSEKSGEITLPLDQGTPSPSPDTHELQESQVKGIAGQIDLQAPKNALLQVILYYQDAEGCIVPVTRKIPKQEGLARAVVYGLIDSSENREELLYFGLYPILPTGTEVLGMTIKENIAYIDFNLEFLNYKDEPTERRILSALVYTLTEFKNIDGVSIRVNGKNMTIMRFGTDVSGILTRKNIMINSDKIGITGDFHKLDLYLYKQIRDGYLYILPVSKEAKAQDNEAMIFEIFQGLSSKSEWKTFTTEIPSDTQLLDARIEGNTVTLDFNEALRTYGGTTKEHALLQQILFSMKQLEGIERVKLLFEGKEGTLPEGTDISKTLIIPVEINSYIDE